MRWGKKVPIVLLMSLSTGGTDSSRDSLVPSPTSLLVLLQRPPLTVVQPVMADAGALAQPLAG